MTGPSADDRLRDALAALADGVPVPPRDYRRASAGWRRRYRRRRMLLAAVLTVVLLAANALALWALNRTDPDAYVIFSDPASVSTTQIPGVPAGQP